MPQNVYEAIIIGTGFSGLCNGIKLKEANIQNFVILEKSSSVGGTWRENTYPGAACDVQSHLYSFSFAGNPNWSKVFSGWSEIEAYLQRVYDDHQLQKHTKFHAEMIRAQFDESLGLWRVYLKDGEVLTAHNLILGTGPLHVPNIPKLAGLEQFKGEVMHSAQWRHDVDLENKNIVSIGTGGSAIQYVPEVAKQAKKLTVMQRTAAWVMPRNERSYFKIEKWLFSYLPFWRKLYRTLLYWSNESRVLLMLNPVFTKLPTLVSKLHLRMQVKDPVLRKKLTPDYTIGCKRILISNQYWSAFNRENVDLNTDGFSHFVEDGLVDKTGRHIPADVVLLGTGFVADPTVYMKDLPIIGRDGKTLLEWWKDGAEAFKGISVHGCPNLYQMTGPNTGLGHNSVIFMIECQTRYIVDAIKQQRTQRCQAGGGILEVKESVQQTYNQNIQKNLEGTVWQSGCASWYKSEDGKNFTLWPHSTVKYYFNTLSMNAKNYRWLTPKKEQPTIKIKQQEVEV